MEQQFLAAATFVKEYLEKTERPDMGRRNTAGFRWRHMLRVLNAARVIGAQEGADLNVLEMAALLHDIAKLDKRSESMHHAVLGSQIAEEYLSRSGLDQVFIERVVEVVRFHSYDTFQEGLSQECLVLKDADRLDEVGALGVIWVGIHAGRIGMDYRGCFRQGLKDLRNLEDLTLYTASGKTMFENRLQLMTEFWRQAEAELAGERLVPYADL